jgi:hypothetical protein
MKNLKWTLLLMLFGITANSLALANGYYHNHFYPRIGVYIGPGLGWPGYYPGYYPAYYNYPPYGAYGYPGYYGQAVAASSGPTTYVEQGANQSAPPQATAARESAYWYYCDGAQGYYPYVKECPGGWRKVAPQAPRN